MLKIDTNLVLSALVFAGGRLAPLRTAWHAGRCVPLVSNATASELMRVLHYPRPLAAMNHVGDAALTSLDAPGLAATQRP